MKRELRAFDGVIQSVHMNKELVLDRVDEREENNFTYLHKSKIESLDLISWRGLGVRIVKKGRDGTRSLTYSSYVLHSSMQIIQTTIVSSRISFLTVIHSVNFPFARRMPLFFAPKSRNARTLFIFLPSPQKQEPRFLSPLIYCSLLPLFSQLLVFSMVLTSCYFLERVSRVRTDNNDIVL